MFYSIVMKHKNSNDEKLGYINLPNATYPFATVKDNQVF
jgi:hypothetical protein